MRPGQPPVTASTAALALLAGILVVQWLPRLPSTIGTLAGLSVQNAETVTREKRPPHFEVISLIAKKA